jgi:hypothetical protein
MASRYLIKNRYYPEFIEVTEVEAFDLLQARNCVQALTRVEEVFALLAETFVEFERYLLDQTIHLAYYDHALEGFSRIRDGVNVRVFSLLSAARAYHDQRKSAIRGTSYIAADVRDRIEALFSEKFETELLYRFMEGLRNFSQHHDIPVRGTSISHQIERDPTRPSSDNKIRERITLQPFFLVDEIIDSNRLKSKLRKELEDQEISQLDARYCVRKYLGDIAAAHYELRAVTQKALHSAQMSIVLAGAKFRTATARNDDTLILVEQGGESGEEMKNQDLLRDTFESLTERRKAWSGLAKAEQRYVSSQLTKLRATFYPHQDRVWIPK